MKDNGSSKSGATKGSLGDASMSDLERGYSDASPTSKEMDDVEQASPFDSQNGGFTGRPSGWER